MSQERPKPTPENIQEIIALNELIGKIQERNLREILLNNPNIKEINELIAYDFDEEGNMHLHVLPNQHSTITEKMTLMKQGLKLTANILIGHPEVKFLYATSWIVAENPKLLEMLGFTIEGEISEIERTTEFSDEQRDVWKAVIPREDFIDRYNKT